MIMNLDLAAQDDTGVTWRAHATVLLAPDATTTGNPTAGAAPAPAPAAPTDMPTPILPGVHDPRTPDQLVAAFPGVRYTRQFVGDGEVLNTPDDTAGLITMFRTACAPSWNAGLVPIVSVKLNVAQVAAGRWAPALHALGAYLATQPPTMVVFWHEPEDDMTAAAFVPYFNAARQQLHAGGPIPVVYAAMAYQWAPAYHSTSSIKGHTDDPAAWAAVDADVYAIDAYNGRSFPLGQILPEHPGYVRWYAWMIAAHPGRVFIVGERGFELADATSATQSVIRANTINREVAWLRSGAAVDCIGWVYWNTPGTEGSATLALDQRGLAALRDAVASLHTTGAVR